MSVTTAEFEKSLDNDPNFQAFYAKIVSQINSNLAIELINHTSVVFKSKLDPIKKFRALQFIQKLSVDKPGQMINNLNNNKTLLDQMHTFATTPQSKINNMLGSKADPSIASQFYLLNLECITYWGSKYNKDSKGNPTNLNRELTKVTNKGVAVPDQFIFFPQLQNMAKTTQPQAQQQTKPETQKPTTQSQQVHKPHEHEDQNKEPSPSRKVVPKSELTKKYGDIYASMQEEFKELEGAFEEKEINQDFKDFLPFKKQSLAEKFNEIKELMQDALTNPDALSAGMQKKLIEFKDFCDNFLTYEEQYSKDPENQDEYEAFRFKVLTDCSKFTGSKPPKQEAKQKPVIHEKPVEDNKQSFHPTKPMTDSQKMVEQLVGSDHHDKRNEDPSSSHPNKKPLQHQDTKSDKYPETKMAQSNYNHPKQQDPYQSDHPTSKSQHQPPTQHQPQKQSQYEPPKHSQYQPQTQSQHKPQQQSLQKSYHQPPKQSQYQPPTQPISQSQYKSQAPFQNNNQTQKPQNQYQSQYQPPQSKYSPQKQSQYTHSPKDNKLNKSYVKSNKNHDFDEKFDALSQSNMSIRDFPLQFQNLQEDKDYYGSLVPYDDREFQLFYQIGMSDNQIRRLKVAVLKPRAAVFESPQIQVGIVSKLLYHEMTSKYFLKLVVIIGNKTDQPMLKCNLSYEGDTGMSIWCKDIVVEKAGSNQQDENGQYFLHGGQQLQQQLVVYYNRLPFSTIGGTFEWEDGMNKMKAQFTLPAMLPKFMNFLDTELLVFRQKWHYKKQQIIKSEIIEFNPKIVRSPMIFKRYFPQLIELTDFGDFLNQGQDQQEYKDMKLGGIFTLQSPQIEFMLKIIIRPNLTGLFKIIPYQKYTSQGEQILQNLVFIFGL